MRLLLADDHVVVREALKVLLEREGFCVIGGASDGLAAVAMAQQSEPDVVVLDFTMPGLNGVDAGRAIRRSCRRTRTVLLTMHAEDEYVHAAFEAGIHGYVLKTQASTDLVHAIRAVVAGRSYLSPGLSRPNLSGGTQAFQPRLTLRERQVVQLIAEGHTTRAVAARLSISPKTVESHRMNLMQKLGIHDVAGLVRYTIRVGLISA